MVPIGRANAPPTGTVARMAPVATSRTVVVAAPTDNAVRPSRLTTSVWGAAVATGPSRARAGAVVRAGNVLAGAGVGIGSVEVSTTGRGVEPPTASIATTPAITSTATATRAAAAMRSPRRERAAGRGPEGPGPITVGPRRSDPAAGHAGTDPVSFGSTAVDPGSPLRELVRAARAAAASAPAVGYRESGAFAIPRATTASSPIGMPDRWAEGRGGSRVRCAPMIASWDVAGNGLPPVRISCSTQVSA